MMKSTRTNPIFFVFFILLCASCGRPSESEEILSPGKSKRSAVSENKPVENPDITATDASPKAMNANTASMALLPEQAQTQTQKEMHCKRQPFAVSVKLAEASGATMLDDHHIFVVGDSGTNGAFVILDSATGKVTRRGHLLLDKNSSDDLEGLTMLNGELYAITSSGWLRRWTPCKGAGYCPVKSSYSLAPPQHRNYACVDSMDSNCAKNYEGLCMQAHSPKKGECVGFAAAKATGDLICIIEKSNGKLQLDPSREIHVASPRSLSGCNFDDQDRLWFGNNFFAANTVGYIENWQTPKEAIITRIGPLGLGFGEALTIGPGGQVFRFSDTAGSPSLLSKYICR